MDQTLRASIDNLQSGNMERQNQAFTFLMESTDKPVTWAYEAWEDLLQCLRSKDNHQRAIAAQVLCNLAKSDPEQRLVKDFDVLLEVTRDKRFVTARHCIQSLWKIGVAGPAHKERFVKAVDVRFHDSAAEKNCTLIRYDLLAGVRKVYDETKDEALRQKATEWIDSEADLKYRKKYATLWRT